MYIVENYGLAVALCWVTMLCWGMVGENQDFDDMDDVDMKDLR